MDLRDSIAVEAINGLIIASSNSKFGFSISDSVKTAYEIADEMIKVRGK